MNREVIKELPLDNVHVYLEICRRFIFGVKVQPGYEESQKSAKLAIMNAIKMLTPPKEFPVKVCPRQPQISPIEWPLRPTPPELKSKK